MKDRHQSITIAEIPADMAFEGYLWYSHEQKPRMQRNKHFTLDQAGELPFIVEGNLWSEENAISIQIRHVDGHYLVQRFNLAGIADDPLIDEMTYLAHDLEGVKAFRVAEAWEESEPDSLLEGMTTLVPAWTAFTGFRNK